VTNNSTTTTATDVRVNESLPPGTALLDASAPCALITTFVECRLGDIPPKENAVVTIRIVPGPDAPDTIRNSATALSSRVRDPKLTNNTDTARTTILSDATPTHTPGATPTPRGELDLEVIKVGPVGPVRPGDLITFQIFVSNLSSTVDATNVVIREEIPEEVTLESSSLPCTQPAPGFLDCTVGEVKGLERRELRVTFRVRDDVPPGEGIVNTARLGSVDQADVNPENDEDSAFVDVLDDDSADLEIVRFEVQGGNPIRAGQMRRLVLLVRNNGPARATGINLDITLPPELSFDKSAPVLAFADCKTRPDNSKRVICQLPLPLAPGASERVSFGIKTSVVLLGRPRQANARVVGTQPDPVPTNNDRALDLTFAPLAAKIVDPNTRFFRLIVSGADDDATEARRIVEGSQTIGGAVDRTENRAADSLSVYLVQPRRRDIKRELTSFKELAQPGDEVTFLYNGHGWNEGTAGRDLNKDEPPDAFMDTKGSGLPFDETIWVNIDEDITDDDLNFLLQGFRPGVSILVFLDSCFGGGFTDGRADLKDRLGLRVIAIKGSTCLKRDYLMTLSEFAAAGVTPGDDGRRPADANGDSIVTGDELANFMTEKGAPPAGEDPIPAGAGRSWSFELGPPDPVAVCEPKAPGTGSGCACSSTSTGCGNSDDGACTGPGLEVVPFESGSSLERRGVATGRSIALSGVNFAPESEVTIDLLGADLPRTLLDSTSTDADGTFSAIVDLPVLTPDITYSLVATDSGGMKTEVILLGDSPGDLDQDGVLDHSDNCPEAPNPDQRNVDGDKAGAACDCDDRAALLQVCNTPVGVGPVTVSQDFARGGGLEVTFPTGTVRSGGETALGVLETAAMSLSGFVLLPKADPLRYEVSTSAKLEGEVEVCVRYEGVGLTAAEEAGLVPLRCEDETSCVPLPASSHDVNGRVLCVRTDDGLFPEEAPLAVGVPEDIAACPLPDERATVTIGGCDSKVPNETIAAGCTAADLIAGCAQSGAIDGPDACLRRVVRNLQTGGHITEQEAQAILECAGQT
jgi:uncharacterized repeat protein (TIGR01451 family)